jgi:hypothetical protein
MDKRYNDTDLREALHRKYADTPQLPADFMAKMKQRMDAKPVGKTRRLWPWLSAAACILLIIGIGLHVQFSDWTRPVAQSSTLNQSIEHAQSINRARSVAQSSTVNPSTDHGQSINRPRSIDQSTVVDSDPDLHYAAADLTKDTIPYQDPARVDDFIAKMAEYNKVKESELTCSTPLDSNVVSRVYVFPDKQEIDVFGRLLQVACSYSDATPGYHLYFSHLQFFFELQDVRKHLQYRWIAERVNGKILLYSTNAPLGVNTSSACYQEYRDELMNTKIINTKTKEI